MPDTFGNRLRSLIQQKGLTQQELADALDLPRNTIWRWINEKATPRGNILLNLATFLQISVDDLLNDPPPEHSGEWTIHINVADKFSQEVIDLNGNIQPIAQMTVTPDGIAFTVKSDWEKLKTEAGLKQLFKQVLKAYPAMRNNGVALGAIKD